MTDQEIRDTMRQMMADWDAMCERIKALARESAEAGDHAMVAICQIAIDGEADPLTLACVSAADRELLGLDEMTPAEARAECARVLSGHDDAEIRAERDAE